eukprot:s39_g20.t1
MPHALTGSTVTRRNSVVKCQIGTTDSAGDSRGLAARVDADADICYCEAKHVQSFYASIARNEQGKRDFDSYAGRVLILDEVDALVIDEEPNEPFVYPNTELSEIATTVASGLHSGKRWWQAPGAKAEDNPLSDYDRDAS